MSLSRRNLLTSAVSTIGLLGAASAFGRAQDLCLKTPEQPEGPFYPVRDQLDKNNDLTFVEGRRGRATGSIIYLQGVVTDVNCQPVKDVVVEIWQACATGRYNHPGDRENPNVLDPNFQYWGIIATDQLGRYNFKTIVPGHYSAGADWIRPPHIHFKVHKRGYYELITQMYFVGNQYNEGDLILKKLSSEERKAVVVAMVPRGNPNEHEFDCAFDIMVTPVS